jgi:hypothetical protein
MWSSATPAAVARATRSRSSAATSTTTSAYAVRAWRSTRDRSSSVLGVAVAAALCAGLHRLHFVSDLYAGYMGCGR